MWKVLIADDEPKIRRGLGSLLSSFGGDLEIVAEAEDGAMAFDMAVELKPDILLIDVRMPFRNGLDLIEGLATALPGKIVIIVSGHDELRGAVDILHSEGGVARDERDMFGGLLELSEVTVSDIMVHRTKMRTLDADLPPDELVREVLGQYNYRVIEASSGVEALKAWDEHDGKIDLLLTDMVMPKMNGRDLAKRLHVLHPQMRVIFMSGHTDPAILKEVMDRGVPFLIKPFQSEVLARKVREVLESKGNL